MEEILFLGISNTITYQYPVQVVTVLARCMTGIMTKYFVRSVV